MSVLQTTKSFAKLCGYNMRIIFAGKFIWFLLVGLVLFFFLMYTAAARGTSLSHGMVYSQLIIPGLLLVFYPSCFGIQNDADHRDSASFITVVIVVAERSSHDLSSGFLYRNPVPGAVFYS